MNDDQIVFVDCETTGLDHTRHVPWEVAVICDDEEYVWQVKLTEDQIAAADAESLRICRFDERYVGRDIPPSDSIVRLYDGTVLLTPSASARLWGRLTEGRRIVGIVPSFDELMMRHQWMSIYGWDREFPWHYQTIDVEVVALGYALRCEHEMTGSGFPDEIRDPLSGNYLSEYFSVPLPTAEEAHTAIGDARWASRLWYGVT